MRLPYLLVAAALTAAPVSASEAGKLLPAEAELVVTFNVRQFLDDHKSSDLVRSYGEQWRLALKGDEAALKKYYRDRDLARTEGVSEQEFLDRATLFRSVRNFLGVDLLQDVDRITLGFTRGDTGFWAVIVEGRFPGKSHGTLVKLNDNTLTYANSNQWLDVIKAQADGSKAGGLSQGTRSLLDRSAQFHLALVVNKVDVLLKNLLNLTDKATAGQVAALLEKFGTDVSSASIGLSSGSEELNLQWGLETTKPETAQELETLIKRGNILASLALLARGNNLSKQLATILVQQRVEVRKTTLVVHMPIPHDIIRNVVESARTTHYPYTEELTLQR